MHATALAVLAAPVPFADRRGLSQAWFSALHLAERETPPVGPRRPPRVTADASGNAVGASRPPVGRPPVVSSPATAGRRAAPVAAAPPAPPGDRRAAPSRLARAIVRAFVARRTASGTLTVASESGRVRLVVRVEGDRTRIVALCAPADRDAVDRALGAARYALAARGGRVDVDLRADG